MALALLVGQMHPEVVTCASGCDKERLRMTMAFSVKGQRVRVLRVVALSAHETDGRLR